MKRPRETPYYRVMEIIAKVAERYKRRRVRSRVIAGEVIAELELPTDNSTQVFLFETALIQLSGAFLRRHHGPGVGNPPQQFFSTEFEPDLQDRYAIPDKDGETCSVPREQMTAAEYRWVIARLQLLGNTYYEHAHELEIEYRGKFPGDSAGPAAQ